MATSKRRDRNCTHQWAGCTQWNGCDIAVLGIKNGDYLDDIILAIAKELATLATPADLSTISTKCLAEQLGMTVPKTNSLLTLMQLALDSSCELKALVDELSSRIDGNTATLALNLGCLATYDSTGTQLPYTETTVLQALLNEACSQRSNINTLSGQVSNLQSQFSNFKPDNYTEPVISDCFSNAKPLSTAYKNLSQDYCAYKEDVGTTDDIQIALSLQGGSMANDFKAVKDFVQNPASLAQDEQNQWVVLNNLYARMAALEACACKVKCSDLIVNFQVIDNADGTGVTLQFGAAYGTTIDSSFSDNGSTVTFVDVNGKKLSFPITIKQEFISPEYDLSQLQRSTPITIKLCAQLSNGTQTCCQCTDTPHLVVNGTDDCCPVTINGTSGQVTLNYASGGVNSTISSPANTIVYLPANATNVTYIASDGITLTSPCVSLACGTMNCYKISWALTNNGDSHTQAWDEHTGAIPITAIYVNGQRYTVNIPECNDFAAIEAVIASTIPQGLLSNRSYERINHSDEWNEDIFHFRTTQSIADSIYFEFQVEGTTSPRMFAISETCPGSSSA